MTETQAAAAKAPTPLRTIVLVGHCVPDEFLLKNAIRRAVPGAMVEHAGDHDALKPHLHAGSLLLVNRVLDGWFDAADGIELIKSLPRGDDGPVAMLISNYPEAQAAAVAAGARQGFGKSAVHKQQTAALLRDGAAR
jgi:hypothetical protein